MKNEEETNELIALMQRLGDERDMIGWLCTIGRNIVTYENNPEAAEKIQEQLNNANTLISLTYMWALLEEAEFNELSKWISSADKEELKAWKHIRHTGAHAPGSRAQGYKTAFDDFMNSPGSGRSGLKENCKFTKNSIELTDGMNWNFLIFIQDVVQNAVAYCAEDKEPN